MTTLVYKKRLNWSKQFSRISLYTLCISLTLIFIAPIGWALITSVKPPAEASASPSTYLPTYLTFQNYVKLNKYGAGIYQYVINSFIVALLTVAGSIILSTLAGFGFSRFDFPGKKVAFILILATLMIPFQSVLTPLFLLLGFLKLQNNLVGLALVYITFQLPFGVFVMRNTFDAIPKELEEAALLDGCSPFTLFYSVMIKLATPGVITVSLYAFINSWNEFLAALIFMSKEDKFTLPILLANVRSGLFGQIDWGALQAGVTLTIIPCIILFLLLQRYYMQGLMGGAIKG